MDWRGSLITWAIILTPILVYVFWPQKKDDGFRRGRKLVNYLDAWKENGENIDDKTGRPFFGGLYLPQDAIFLHFGILGATASGKTISLRLLMQSLLPLIRNGSDARALIYDPKRDMPSILAGMKLECPIKLLNPFDDRSVAWDMAADITDPVAAREMAMILIPEESGVNRYFSDAARDILAGVIIALNRALPGEWTFRHVCLLLRNPVLLRTLLEQDPETKDIVERHFKEERTFHNVFSTLATKMILYEPIGSAWANAKEKISLEEWVEGECILVLGQNEAARSSLDAINRIIFKRLSELLLSQSESTTRRTFIFLDEARDLEKLDGLSRLLTQGRSKGVSATLALQDVDGFRAAHTREIAHEILGQCCNKAILRLESPETAKFASQIVGEQEVVEWRKSVSNNGTTLSDNKVTRPAVLPSQFLSIPPANPVNGLCGYYVLPNVGVYYTPIRGEWISENLLPRDQSVPDFVPRPKTDLYLAPLTPEELARLGLSRGTNGSTGKGLRIENRKGGGPTN